MSREQDRHAPLSASRGTAPCAVVTKLGDTSRGPPTHQTNFKKLFAAALSIDVVTPLNVRTSPARSVIDTFWPDCTAEPLASRSARFCAGVLFELSPLNIERSNWTTSPPAPAICRPEIDLAPNPDEKSKVSEFPCLTAIVSLA